jgi:prepilin peptidase dependent protein B
MPTMSIRAPSQRRISARNAARGLSIVELMIGITISLFILAGATMVLTSQLGDNRRLLLEAQVQQDLRAAADMISRDIRRAGYWGKAHCSVWPATNCAVVNNPYTAMVPQSASLLAPAAQVVYDRSTDEEGGRLIGTDDDDVDVAVGRPRERVGFRWNADNRTIDYLVGANNWQALTDAAVLQVTRFDMLINARDLPMPCGAGACPVLGPGGCPLFLRSRDVAFTIVARAVHDDKVQRSLRDNVRLRNTVPTEVCPAPPAGP